MKPNQKSITISFESEKKGKDIQEKLYNYLRAQKKEKKSVKNSEMLDLLNLALDLKSGAYREEEILKLSGKIDNLIQVVTITQESLKLLQVSIADLQDDKTQQMSDESLLTQPTTKFKARSQL